MLAAPFVLALVSHTASADCVIFGMRPTVALPTTDRGQEFSFLASDDCATLRLTIAARASRGGRGAAVRQARVRRRTGRADRRGVGRGRRPHGADPHLIVTDDKRRRCHARDDDERGPCVPRSQFGDCRRHAARATRRRLGRVGPGTGRRRGRRWAARRANRADPYAASERGVTYLVSGPVSGTFDLSDARARLVGAGMQEWAGTSVAGASDVDGDG